jgi:hypothetical protein
LYDARHITSPMVSSGSQQHVSTAGSQHHVKAAPPPIQTWAEVCMCVSVRVRVRAIVCTCNCSYATYVHMHTFVALVFVYLCVCLSDVYLCLTVCVGSCLCAYMSGCACIKAF